MIQGFLLTVCLFMFGLCFFDIDSHSHKRKEDIHFKTMAFMHDNSLRRLLDKPERTLEAAGLRSGDRVLEVGCGPGYFTVEAGRLVGKNGTVHSIDINLNAVNRTSQKVKESGLENIRVKKADAADTGLPDNSIDAILLFSVLPHLPLDTVLPEFYRILKPEGHVAVRGIRAMSLTVGGYFSSAGKNRQVYLFSKIFGH